MLKVVEDLNANLDLTLYADATELVEVTTSEAFEVISLKLLEKGLCHIALTGGTLGYKFSKVLVNRLNNSADLSGLNIWFSDERFVPVDSALRNSRPVNDGLHNSSVTIHNVKSTDECASVQEAAASYAVELRNIKMDICFLGLGADAHVASLFPHYWDPTAIGEVIAIVDSPKPPSERVSFSMEFINSSAHVWVIAAGPEKVGAVTQVLEADPSVPAGHVMASEITRLIVDTEAFLTE